MFASASHKWTPPSLRACPTLRTVLTGAALLPAMLCAACDRSPAGGTAGPPPDREREHVHVAPHGGHLIELGEHFANLELVLDRATGKLTAYVLDGHAGHALRIAQERIEIRPRPGADAVPGAATRPTAIELRAVQNALTGETAWNTSQFEGAAAGLEKQARFSGVVSKIEVLGRSFENVAFEIE